MAKRIISKQQHIILLLLYIFRFLNRVHIQKFLLNKGDRGINRLLKKLVNQGYVERDFKPIFGTLTKPAVYFLTASGREYIRNSYQYHFPKYLKRIARDKNSSKAFRIRCQIIADWYLLLFPPVNLRILKQQAKDNKTTQQKEQKNNTKKGRKKKKISEQKQTGIAIIDTIVRELTVDTENTEEKIPLNTAQFFTPAYFPNLSLLPGVKPDAVIRKRTIKGIKLWFLFVLDAYIPRFILKYQFQRIINTLSDETWEEDIYTINILTISPNHQIIVYAKRLLPSLLERYYGNTIQFYFATRNQLYKAQSGQSSEIPWVTISSTDL